jgi:integrase/recombinase XerD
MTFKDYLIANGHSSLVYSGIIKRLLENNIKLTKEDLYNHVLRLKQQYSVEYVNLNIKAIKSYLLFKGLNIQMPKLSVRVRKLPDSITKEYFEHNIIPMIGDIFPNILKVKALLYFMFYTGIRKGELVYIKRNWIDLNSCTVKIYEKKTKKERLTIFPKRIGNILKEYFDYEPEQENAFNIGKYSISYIFSVLKPFFPNINLRPHLFRHSFATHLLRNGVDISIVSKLLGHNNLQTTMVYLSTDIKLLKEVYNNKIK